MGFEPFLAFYFVELEFHQLFIPGRYGCFADVVLDNGNGFHSGLASLESVARQLGAKGWKPAEE